MIYVYRIATSGARLSLAEYLDLAAINRDDFVLWNEAERQRQNDAIELANKEAARGN